MSFNSSKIGVNAGNHASEMLFTDGVTDTALVEAVVLAPLAVSAASRALSVCESSCCSFYEINVSRVEMQIRN